MIIVQIAGRLGKDAETRFTPSGQKVTTMTIATNVRKGGKEETVWWRVTIWGDRFDKLMPYFKKGTGLIVVGEMGKPEIWTDKEGRPQVSLEITAEIIRFSPFGNPEKTGQEGQQTQQQSYSQKSDYSQDIGYGDHGGASQSMGATYGAVSGGGSQKSYASPDEEPLPF